jgi:cobalt/nickel transport protein
MQLTMRIQLRTGIVAQACAALAATVLASAAHAHFGMVIPSDNMVLQGESRDLKVLFAFAHPFEREGMPLVKPVRAGVHGPGGEVDLLPALKPMTFLGHPAFTATYSVGKPGTYIFFMEPQPYWEPAEDVFIKHYTKTYVTAFENDEGWDAELGLPTEITPLTKPFALYAGNVFQGIVKVDGKPVPYAEVEVEYYNEARKPLTAPTPYMITQTIKADGNGVFTYAAPAAGWWGFAALSTADYQLEQAGEKKDVEIGAVVWVRFERWLGR